MKKTILFASLCLIANSSFAQPGPGMIGGMGKGSNCTPAANYHFKGQLDMNIVMVGKSKDSIKTKSTSYYNNSNHSFAIENEMNMKGNEGAMTMVINLQDSVVVSLMNFGEMKMASCSSMKGNSRVKRSYKMLGKDNDWNFNNFKKTGKSKIICGYLCEEYSYEKSDTSIAVWISNEVKLPEIANEGIEESAVITIKESTGMTLEMVYVISKTKEYFQMQVTKIDLNIEKDISTEGYIVR